MTTTDSSPDQPTIDRWIGNTALATMTLSQNWLIQPCEQFSDGTYSEDTTWHAIAIPSHWQQHPDLAEYAGRVVYRCHFETPPPPQTSQPIRAWLRFNGVFYWSRPYLNGHDLGRHEGYFIPSEHDITHVLRPPSEHNQLVVEVECPNEHNKSAKRMITGVFSHWDCLDPAANPGGIWLPVELHYSGPIRLHALRCHTESFDSEAAHIHYTARLDTTSPGPIHLRWTITPRTFSGEPQIIHQTRTLHYGRQEIRGLLKVPEPRLWWTHDLGTPDRYTIAVEILQHDEISDRISIDTGIRRFELRNWIASLNGVRFLIKGSNYAPGDMRIATMNTERCTHDMHLARACHMNLLRIHAHVDHPALYAAADAAGILLWQDMPLQWLYQAGVLAEARRQARAMVRLLYNHPSLVLWCMHNEPFFVANTHDEGLLSRLHTYQSAVGFSWNRDVLDARLKQTAEQEDPHRPVIRSSGEVALPGLRSGTDTHLYFGWYRAYGTLADFETLRQRMAQNLRFVTEFGAQSFPNRESCIKFFPDDITRIDFRQLAERHGFQPEMLSHWVPWRNATSLEELIAWTQEYQSNLNRFYIDRLRYQKYRPTGGIVSFCFADAFPAILWSILDYWRVPKRSYHALRAAFSPHYAFTLIEPRPYRVAEPILLPLYAVNDAHYPIHGLLLTARLMAPDRQPIAHVEHLITLDADCQAQEVDRLRLTPTAPGHYRLVIELTSGGLTSDHGDHHPPINLQHEYIISVMDDEISHHDSG